MTEKEKEEASRLLDQIELAAGELPDRSGAASKPIAEILQSVNGLRSLLGVVRPH